MIGSEASLLKASHLGFEYSSGRPIFKEINIEVAPREIVVLLGSSGCGKSSLLRVLSGLAAPAEGHVHFHDSPLKTPHPRSALVFQQASLLPWLNVEDNVAYGLNFKHQPKVDKEEKNNRILRALSAVGLSDYRKSWPSRLSGGQAQRVALARALARQPELLFADEPFSALDAITRAEMQRLLVNLVHEWNTAVLLVTHDLDEALAVADRIILMGSNPGYLINEWNLKRSNDFETNRSEQSRLREVILGSMHSISFYSNAPIQSPNLGFAHA